MAGISLALGMMVIGCDTGTGGEGETIIGTYSGIMAGQKFTLTVARTSWTISATTFSDSGTYILNGNTATLISNMGNADTETTEVGTATINENTITIILNDRSWFPGTYTATKIDS
jgi:hypothetical protein